MELRLHFDLLPLELESKIFSYLDPKSLDATCRVYPELQSNESFWIQMILSRFTLLSKFSYQYRDIYLGLLFYSYVDQNKKIKMYPGNETLKLNDRIFGMTLGYDERIDGDSINRDMHHIEFYFNIKNFINDFRPSAEYLVNMGVIYINRQLFELFLIILNDDKMIARHYKKIEDIDKIEAKISKTKSRSDDIRGMISSGKIGPQTILKCHAYLDYYNDLMFRYIKISEIMKK